jgi:hypothetical protein
MDVLGLGLGLGLRLRLGIVGDVLVVVELVTITKISNEHILGYNIENQEAHLRQFPFLGMPVLHHHHLLGEVDQVHLPETIPTSIHPRPCSNPESCLSEWMWVRPRNLQVRLSSARV